MKLIKISGIFAYILTSEKWYVHGFKSYVFRTPATQRSLTSKHLIGTEKSPWLFQFKPTSRSVWNIVIKAQSDENDENDDYDDIEEKMSEVERMARIRAIQNTYYAPPAKVKGDIEQDLTFKSSNIDLDTGCITNLPLWRVQWTELPGRSNVLHIHQGHYTHMFETILRSSLGPPWYVGHLLLPGGSANLNKEEYRLEGILETSDEQNSQPKPKLGSPVVGTLLEIVDFRRFGDGKLLLLVHGLERFVVTETVRELPYSIAHVQILPDLEEITTSVESWLSADVHNTSESIIASNRSLAIQTSFKQWHSYEFGHRKLPVRNGDPVSISDIIGSELTKVMPLVPLGQLDTISMNVEMCNMTQQVSVHNIETRVSREISIEQKLVRKNHFKLPSTADWRVLSMPCMNELEERLWFAIEDYVKFQSKHLPSTKFNVAIPIPPELLQLLPGRRPTNGEAWPESLTLNKFANEWQEVSHQEFKADQAKEVRWATLQKKTSKASLSNVKPIFSRVSDAFPATRRQRRLSYAASVLIESRMTEEGLTFEGYRQHLLQIPSTQLRLWTVLQDFSRVIREVTGDFQ